MYIFAKNLKDLNDKIHYLNLKVKISKKEKFRSYYTDHTKGN